MINIIDKLLDAYEKGGISRRKFIQSVAMLTTSSTALAQADKSAFKGKTINHVTLLVKDVQRSKDFYQKLLGLRVRLEEDGYCSFDLNGGFLAMAQDDIPSADHFCIGIESFNAEAVFEKLKKDYPSSSPTMENDKEVYLRDPDNIRFQLASVDYRH